MSRVFNFSAGPAVLPLPVLQQAQTELVSLPGLGMSILEISHRSKPFDDILQSAKGRIKKLLGVPDNYRIVFLQGGSRLQFSMVPMNLLRGASTHAEYVMTGSWGLKAYQEAVRVGEVRIVWDGKQTNYDRTPEFGQLSFDDNAAYVHVTSNETIEGVQLGSSPDVGRAPLVCDASSDFLSRPIPIRNYGLIYACAQKNAGPAGATVVIIREDLLQRSRDELPGYLNYREHVTNDSLYNTPATFAIYFIDLVGKWLQEEIGGLEQMQKLNTNKAKLLYDVIDSSKGFYAGHAQPECRSMMNVTFRLPSDEIQSDFLKRAEEQGLCNLKGHRSVGGIRASIYNAMPTEGVTQLRDFMNQFRAEHA